MFDELWITPLFYVYFFESVCGLFSAQDAIVHIITKGFVTFEVTFLSLPVPRVVNAFIKQIWCVSSNFLSSQGPHLAHLRNERLLQTAESEWASTALINGGVDRPRQSQHRIPAGYRFLVISLFLVSSFSDRADQQLLHMKRCCLGGSQCSGSLRPLLQFV